jgi:transaldolase
MQNQLEGLRQYSVIVADTGDLESIAAHRPQDATTNPSLVLQAASDARYAPIVDEVIARAKPGEHVADLLFVELGCRILDMVPGRVSTEVDARLSFDTEATVAKAEELMGLYAARGIGPERVLIKIASTWEGIAAAERLERRGIHCNLTLLFSFAQAVACADAGVTLISPFVGRIYDWYRASNGGQDIPREEDPGVASVRRIYEYYKKFGYATSVMGASFRKATQILDLAGCDLLTISPQLLAELAAGEGEVPRALDPSAAQDATLARVTLDEPAFHWLHNQDAMAVEKLADGIRRFDADARKLEAMIEGRRRS